MKSCLDCKFSDLATIDTGPDEGEPIFRCHRYPPTIVRDDTHDEFHQLLPIVNDTDWCGEFVMDETRDRL